jgi:hypothetical protein
MAPPKKGNSLKKATRGNFKTKRANLKPIAEEEETVTMTQSELDTLIAERVAEIIEVEASKDNRKKREVGNIKQVNWRKLIQKWRPLQRLHKL